MCVVLEEASPWGEDGGEEQSSWRVLGGAWCECFGEGEAVYAGESSSLCNSSRTQRWGAKTELGSAATRWGDYSMTVRSCAAGTRLISW